MKTLIYLGSRNLKEYSKITDVLLGHRILDFYDNTLILENDVKIKFLLSNFSGINCNEKSISWIKNIQLYKNKIENVWIGASTEDNRDYFILSVNDVEIIIVTTSGNGFVSDYVEIEDNKFTYLPKLRNI